MNTLSAAQDTEFRHILAKARAARAGGFGVLSRGEKLACALLLNRVDWLQEMEFTIMEAIERVGPEWMALLPRVARELERDNDADGDSDG